MYCQPLAVVSEKFFFANYQNLHAVTVYKIFHFGDVFVDAQPIQRLGKLTRLYFKMFVSKIEETDQLALT